MKLSSYGMLRTTIAAIRKSEDVAAFLPECIALTESDMQSQLSDCSVLHQTATATTEAGNPLVDAAGMVRLVDVWLDGEQIHITDHNSIPPNAAGTGRPESVCMVNKSKLRFYPTPDAAYAVDVLYLPVISPSLAGDEPSDDATNWILLEHPDLYLYGSLVASLVFAADERGMAWQQQYDNAIHKFRSIQRGGNAKSTCMIGQLLRGNYGI